MGQGRNKGRNERLPKKISENDHTTYPTLWNTMKAMLRGKFIAINAYVKKLEKSSTSELIEHIKTPEQKEANPFFWELKSTK